MNITATETVTTLDLREGDIVRHAGMRILLGKRGERALAARHDLKNPIVVWFHGRVINAAEIPDNAPASLSMRTLSQCKFCAPGEHWTVQGNELAEWTREVAA